MRCVKVALFHIISVSSSSLRYFGTMCSPTNYWNKVIRYAWKLKTWKLALLAFARKTNFRAINEKQSAHWQQIRGRTRCNMYRKLISNSVFKLFNGKICTKFRNTLLCLTISYVARQNVEIKWNGANNHRKHVQLFMTALAFAHRINISCIICMATINACFQFEDFHVIYAWKFDKFTS